MEKKLYPLKFVPVASRRPWGGHDLVNKLGKEFVECDDDGNELKIASDELIGESWEIADMGIEDSVIVNGWLAGNTLSEIMETYLERVVGENVYNYYGRQFPLLIKFLDINDKLSVQVHPDDEVAAERYDSLGKSEMWYVLDAEKDAYITLGFNRYVSKAEYIERVATSNLEEVLQKYPVKKGDVYFIPAGMVHSIGKGCLIMEVQQASDLTYRIYDFNRKDADGNLRELHTELAQRAIDYENWQGRKITLQPAQNGMVNLVECPYFQVNEMQVDKPKEYDLAPVNSFVLLSCVEGHVTLKWEDDYLTLTDGETVLIPAEMNSLYIVPTVNTKLLETYINN